MISLQEKRLHDTILQRQSPRQSNLNWDTTGQKDQLSFQSTWNVSIRYRRVFDVMFKRNRLNLATRGRIKVKFRSSDSFNAQGVAGYKETQCKCCGTLLQHPVDARKFKCTVCEVSNVLESVAETSDCGSTEKCIVNELSEVVENCLGKYHELLSSQDEIQSEEVYAIFAPVSKLIVDKFNSAQLLNRTFKPVIKDQILNYEKAVKCYKLIGCLPTKQPIYLALRLFDEILKRPKICLQQWSDYRFIFFIMEVPSLRQCIGSNSTITKTPKIKDLSYSILKRCIGYLGSMESELKIKYQHLLSHLHVSKFQKQWDTLNLYLSYQLQKIGPGCTNSPRTLAENVLNESSPQDEEKKSNGTHIFHPGKQKIPLSHRYRIEKYGIDWHVRTVCRLMTVYFYARRHQNKIDISSFYNMVLDFIDYKRDFMVWYKMHKEQWKMLDDLSLTGVNKPASYTTMCQFPFLLSLGVKIAIMEFETGKMMEHNAEQAFLKALDSKRVYDVNFRVRVRRTHVTQDSLTIIQHHPQDLKKSLRVEFLNEPGIDAGGLKKEWFLLLTRDLFSPDHGLFQYVEESRLSWFAYGTNGLKLQGDHNTDLYYLFGIVLGLAIYNSTILDLHFPRAIYKKLCHEPLSFDDYEELYPDTARNLRKMLEFETADDLYFQDAFSLTFETSYQESICAKTLTRQLCPRGDQIPVTLRNRAEFVRLWTEFYMVDVVKDSYKAFEAGFMRVIGDALAFPMFTSSEVERLICGSVEQDMDFSQLRAVTKYHNGFSDQTPLVQWLWDLVSHWPHDRQRQFLHFVTGSDRVPVTGLATLAFKVTRITSGPSNQLPTAHTCFNELCLWEYPSKTILESRLTTALDMYEGYGFK